MKWKPFPCYWAFVRGIHRSLVNYPHKGQWCWALMFSFDLGLHKRLSKQWRRRWFETPWLSLWHNCNAECCLLPKLFGRHRMPIACMVFVDKCSGYEIFFWFVSSGADLHQCLVTSLLYLTSKEKILYRAFHHDMLEEVVSLSLSTLKLVDEKRGFRRKLCIPNGVRLGSIQVFIYFFFGPVQRRLFRGDDARLGLYPDSLLKCLSAYHMRQSHKPPNLNLPSL